MIKTMSLSTSLMSIGLTLCVVSIGFAQDGAKKAKQETAKQEKAKTQAMTAATTQVMKAFEAANLTAKQKKQATTIIEKHIAELMTAKKASAELLTADQKKAQGAARKQAKQDGLKGKEAAEKVNEALNLSEEKLAEFKAAAKKSQEVTQKMKDAIVALLTDEQKAALPQPKKQKGAGKGKKKKAEDAATSATDAANLQLVSLKLPNMT